MDHIFKALSHETRRRLVRELRRTPGLKHGQLLTALGMSHGKRGQLTKLLDELEQAGLIEREGAKYSVVAPDEVGQLLSTAAAVNVSAQVVLARRGPLRVQEAKREARELLQEALRRPS